ncbi:MAG: phosphate butyryltransferase [Firmicutes bacterium]|nr:phosphate butyryltransferase [Bacillota bacterium]
MVIKDFEGLIEKVKGFDKKKRMAVVVAEDEHTLEAVIKAQVANIANAVLIGNAEKIRQILVEMNQSFDDECIIDAENDRAAAYKAVDLVNEGRIDFIMKGKIQTADLLSAVVDKERGIRTTKIMSHVVLNEVPSYHKLLLTTDGGMMMYPDVKQKQEILKNAVDALLALGYENPKVAVLAAVEQVNSKMPETQDAVKLKELNQAGVIDNCIVEGPISYDLALSKDASSLKGYESLVSGDVDILLVPNITAGNILGKCLLWTAGARMAGFVSGAKVPIVLASRGSSAEEKYLSLVLAAAVGG